MDKSEVKRHKMYEHIVPISPFEEIKEENKEESPYQNITNTNEPDNIKSLGQRQNSKTTIPANVNTTKGLDDINSTDNSNNYNKMNDNSSNTTVGNRLRGLRPFRL
jgi:hypothetical protein